MPELESKLKEIVDEIINSKVDLKNDVDYIESSKVLVREIIEAIDSLKRHARDYPAANMLTLLAIAITLANPGVKNIASFLYEKMPDNPNGYYDVFSIWPTTNTYLRANIPVPIVSNKLIDLIRFRKKELNNIEFDVIAKIRHNRYFSDDTGDSAKYYKYIQKISPLVDWEKLADLTIDQNTISYEQRSNIYGFVEARRDN